MPLFRPPQTPVLSVVGPDAEPPVPAEGLALAGGGLTGAALAEDRGRFGLDRLRGLLRGLATAGGGLLGARYGADETGLTPASVGYGALGAGLGFLSSIPALKAVGIDRPKVYNHHEEEDFYHEPPSRWLMGKDAEEGQDVLAATERPAVNVVAELRRAKDHSDNRRYGQKHTILRRLLMHDPDGFQIDQDDGGPIVGLRHVESGFKIHFPRGLIPTGLRLAAYTPPALPAPSGGYRSALSFDSYLGAR